MTFNGKNIIFLESDDFINNTLIYKNKPVKEQKEPVKISWKEFKSTL